MKRFLPTILSALLTLQVMAQTVGDKPILTIGCISDFHCEKSLVQTSDPTKVQLRGSVPIIFQKMAQDEDVDIILVGGDCTSEAEVKQEVWQAVKELMQTTIRGAFKDGKKTPVLYVAGNHEYELSEKSNGKRKYNSADYYTYPMKQDVGELAEGEYTTETIDFSGGSQQVMSAYHYNVYGFDFVGLNCGKYSFDWSDDYQYPVASVEWVDKKLDEIYKDDPDKTVFFFLHIPFNDSNSLRFYDKGLKDNESSRKLKAALSKHPNLIMLYGHDHGGDRAFTRRTSAQRVTLYDTNGRVIPTFDDKHVKGATADPENDFCDNVQEFALYNAYKNKYLGDVFDNCLRPLDTKSFNCIFTPNTTGDSYTVSIDDCALHNGPSAASFSEQGATAIQMYKVDGYEDGKLVAHKTSRPDELVEGDDYLVVRYPDSKGYYVMACRSVDNEKNMASVKVENNSDGTLLYIPEASAPECVWTLASPKKQEYYYIKSTATGRYLDCNQWNLTTLTDKGRCTVEKIADGIPTYHIATEHSGSESNYQPNLFCGTDGYFSSNIVANDIYLYKVTEQTTDNKITAVRSGKIEEGEKYVFVVQCDKDKSKWYILTNKDYVKPSDGGHRMVPIGPVSTTETITLTDNPEQSCLWEFEDATPEPGAPSFFSSFMGSARHYLSGIDPGTLETGTPNVIQGLMIYVYTDRVVLQMKNYNKTGFLNDNNSGITVNETLGTYTSYRKIDVPTNIREVKLEDALYEENNAVYNLAGQRLTAPQKGINIINGKKVFK